MDGRGFLDGLCFSVISTNACSAQKAFKIRIFGTLMNELSDVFEKHTLYLAKQPLVDD